MTPPPRTSPVEGAPTTSAPRPRGRPSVAVERRQQILDAAEVCIIRCGLDATTLDRIAAEAGVTRSNLAHFVGNRDAIVELALERSVTRFVTEMTGLVGDVPAPERLTMFIDAVLEDTPDVVRRTALFNELFAIAGRNERARRILAPAVREVDAWIERMVGDRFPDADPSHRSAVAAALPLLLKEYDRTRCIGAAPGPALAGDVRHAIDLLLGTLGPPAVPNGARH